MKKKALLGLLMVTVATGILICGIFIGKSLPRRPEVSFYAKVLESRSNSLLVEEIPENDVNHRGQMYVSLENPNDNNAVIDENGQPMSLSEVPVGSSVRIVYDGIVLESYPGQIHGAYKIYILE